MQNYSVCVTETLEKVFDVESLNEEMAIDEIELKYNNEEIVLTADDYTSTDIKILKSPKEQEQEIAKQLYDIIYKWIAYNFGTSEAEDPCYNITLLADELSKHIKDLL